MLNLIPKRAAAVSLLRGKRPLQRIQVGAGKHQLEVPMAAVDALYAKVDTSVELHNRDFNPLHWKDFFALKLNAYYLYEAAQSGKETKSALPGLNWFGDLADVYQANAALTQADALLTAASSAAAGPTAPFPIKGENV